MEVMGYVLLLLTAEATNCTGEATVAPLAGELIVTPEAAAAAGVVAARIALAAAGVAVAAVCAVKNSLIAGAEAAAPGKLLVPNAVIMVRSRL